ncbi:MAG: antitoxin MazE family protein [Legionellales bacterium]|nr:antitoxin MazE family protein [Legionellales bacterium]
MRKTISERVKNHRDKLRFAGLRPIQLWVPDTRQQGFEAECQRQSMLLSRDKDEKAMLDWLESISDKDDWV